MTSLATLKTINPHTDPDGAARALEWAVKEIERLQSLVPEWKPISTAPTYWLPLPEPRNFPESR